MRWCLNCLDTFNRWLWRMLRENLFFLLSVPLVALILLNVPQIATVVTESVAGPVGQNWQETLWAIGFLEVLVCMGAFSFASALVVPTPPWILGQQRHPWRLLRPSRALGYRVSRVLVGAVLAVVAMVPLALNRFALTDFILTRIVVPVAVLVLAFVMARYLRIAAYWLVWLAWKLGLLGQW